MTRPAQPTPGFPARSTRRPSARPAGSRPRAHVPGPQDLQAQGFHQPVLRGLHGNAASGTPLPSPHFRLWEPSSAGAALSRGLGAAGSGWEAWSHARGRGREETERLHQRAVLLPGWVRDAPGKNSGENDVKSGAPRMSVPDGASGAKYPPVSSPNICRSEGQALIKYRMLG